MNTEIFSERSGRRVAATQSDAYHALTVKDLTEAHRAVMSLFATSEVLLTRYEIADRLGWCVGTACGRVRELLDANRLQVRGTRKESGRRTRQQLLGISDKK